MAVAYVVHHHRQVGELGGVPTGEGVRNPSGCNVSKPHAQPHTRTAEIAGNRATGSPLYVRVVAVPVGSPFRHPHTGTAEGVRTWYTPTEERNLNTTENKGKTMEYEPQRTKR